MNEVLRLPALRIRQPSGREVIGFAVDGKTLGSFAAVSHARRAHDGSIDGYQRPEVARHIKGIRTYVESPDAMLPGAIVVAFDDRVRFEPSGPDNPHGTPGTLIVPVNPAWDEPDKPGLLVDGQQRTAGIRDARVEAFPVLCSGFIARSDADQRAQFLLVNMAKPLSRRLIHELLPTTDAALPEQMLRRRFPARIVERLNHDVDSPLHQLIATQTTLGRFTDTAMLKMVQTSLTDGVLYHWRDPASGEGDIDTMLDVLKAFWAAVQLTWPEAFSKTPKYSRLVHGAGVVALGAVMDTLADGPDQARTVEQFADGLARLAPVCAWTSGRWQLASGGVRAWNELQNTGADIRLLADHLIRQLREQPPVPGARPPVSERVKPADELLIYRAVEQLADEQRAAGRQFRGAYPHEIYAQVAAHTGWAERAFATRFGRLVRAGLLRGEGMGQEEKRPERQGDRRRHLLTWAGHHRHAQISAQLSSSRLAA